MNCQAVQNTILSLPDPRHIPDPLRKHVVGCAACRVWAEQAARLEGLLERLPVPFAPAGKKAALVEDLIRKPVGEPLGTPARREFGLPLRDFLRRNGTLVGGLAAAILVAVGAWALLPMNGPKPEVAEATPDHPFLKKVAQRDVALARTETAAQKLQALGGLTDDLSAEAVALARVASPEDLKDIARWFDRVVKDGLVKQAEKLPEHAMKAAERKAEFTALALKLGETATRAEKATAEVAPEAKPALERIRDSARFGQKKLTELAGGN